jgi:hypothetical protein
LTGLGVFDCGFGFGFDGLAVIPWISWFFFMVFLLSTLLCSGWVDILDGWDWD